MVALAVASKSCIIRPPQNGEFLSVICLFKKSIEINKSNIGVNFKKEDNIYFNIFIFVIRIPKSTKRTQINIHTNYGKH